jgi:predicted Abi (CAAX) family protease
LRKEEGNKFGKEFAQHLLEEMVVAYFTGIGHGWAGVASDHLCLSSHEPMLALHAMSVTGQQGFQPSIIATLIRFSYCQWSRNLPSVVERLSPTRYEQIKPHGQYRVDLEFEVNRVGLQNLRSD